MMNPQEMILLLTNKLNSLNAAIGSAMQSGNIDILESLISERIAIELEIAELRTKV